MWVTSALYHILCIINQVPHMVKSNTRVAQDLSLCTICPAVGQFLHLLPQLPHTCVVNGRSMKRHVSFILNDLKIEIILNCVFE